MSELVFYYSCVNAGKSARLLINARNLEKRGHFAVCLIPSVIGKSKIQSRIGAERDAIVVDDNTNLFELLMDERARVDVEANLKKGKPAYHSYNHGHAHTVFVDEAQFLRRNQVRALADAVDQLGVRVEAYGLRTDSNGEIFEGSRYLLGWADRLVEIETRCSSGSVARFSRAVDPNHDGSQIDVEAEYEPVSRLRFNLF